MTEHVKNFKPNRRVRRLAEELSERGVQIQRLPPSDVEKELKYEQLSDMIDAVIADIFRVCPEIFDNNGTQPITPGVLKAYLYAVALHHFERTGALVSVGGSMPPTCAGVYVPNCFLAWLQYIGTYAEGDIVGKAKYQMPSTIPVVGSDSIKNGAVSEANLCNTSTQLFISIYLSTAQNEPVLQAANANANNFLVQWNTSADTVSDVLQRSDYPSSPMWDEPPPPPDASYYVYPTWNYDTVTNNQTLLFMSPFLNWDAEIAALYYTTNTITGATSTPGYPLATRMGPMSTEWPTTSEQATFAYDEVYFARKQMFCFIIRGATYKPGMPTKKLRVFYGDKLKSFRIVPIAVSMQGWHETLAKAVCQVGFNGAGFTDPLGVYSTLQVHDHAWLRKLQLSSIGLGGNGATIYKMILPSGIDQLTLLAPMSQLVNDLGPVVRAGMLHCPVRPRTVANSQKWYALWQTWGSTGNNTDGPFNHAIQKTAATGDPTLKWAGYGQASATLSTGAGWTTPYEANANPLMVSWLAVFKMHQNMVKWISTGVAYAKGDILYPVSKGPRGSIIMLAPQLPNAENVEDISPQTSATWNFVYRPCAAVYSMVPLLGPDIALALIARYGRGSTAQSSAVKYERAWEVDGQEAVIDRYVSETLTPGGTFIDMLSQAMEKRHSGATSGFGIVSANDNLDACLWDAVKSVAGMIAGAIQPAVGKAAALGCGAIPLVGGVLSPYCADAATALVGFVKDNALTSTNRHEQVPPAVEEKKIEAIVKATPEEPMGELPELRPPPVPSRMTGQYSRAMRNIPHGGYSDDEEDMGAYPLQRPETQMVLRKTAGRNANKQRKVMQRIRIVEVKRPNKPVKVKAKVVRSTAAKARRKRRRQRRAQ